MDSDRKYRQHGYSDSSSYSNGHRSGSNGNGGGDKPRSSGPRPPIDITGPRLPRLVQAVTAARCYNCSTTLPGDIDFSGSCPKCAAALHCCKQCVHFEPSTRFQCLKPIPVRIAGKDLANECGLFSSRVTVARESTSTQSQNGVSRGPQPGLNTPPPRNASDARDAFDRLFRK
jgi:hypothetical protein